MNIPVHNRSIWLQTDVRCSFVPISALPSMACDLECGPGGVCVNNGTERCHCYAGYYLNSEWTCSSKFNYTWKISINVTLQKNLNLYRAFTYNITTYQIYLLLSCYFGQFGSLSSINSSRKDPKYLFRSKRLLLTCSIIMWMCCHFVPPHDVQSIYSRKDLQH